MIDVRAEVEERPVHRHRAGAASDFPEPGGLPPGAQAGCEEAVVAGDDELTAGDEDLQRVVRAGNGLRRLPGEEGASGRVERREVKLPFAADGQERPAHIE